MSRRATRIDENTAAGDTGRARGRGRRRWAVQPDRAQPLGPQIYAQLRRAIVRGDFAPDDTLDERRIAAELGVSRTPVREAVRRLVDERLVDVVRQSSTRVAAIDLALIEESRLIRRTLELESAARAAPHMSARHVETLRQSIAEQRRCVDERRFADAIEVDDRFHHAIASVNGLERLWRTIELEKAHVDRCRRRMLALPGEAEMTLEQHERIVRALLSGDADKARAAMAAHLDAAWDSTRRKLATATEDA